MVIRVAKDYESEARKLGIDLLDLISEGNIGLVTAVHKYEAKRGARLSTYAYYWIRRNIRHALNTQRNGVRVPCWNSPHRVSIVSLDEPLNAESEITFKDNLPSENSGPDTDYCQINLFELVKMEFHKLKSNVRKVLELRFGLKDGKEMIHEDIAKRIGLSHEKVRQIEAKAIKKIRKCLKEKLSRCMYEDGVEKQRLTSLV